MGLTLKQGETFSILAKTDIDLTGYELVSLLHDTDDEAEGLAFDLSPLAVVDDATQVLSNVLLSLDGATTLSLLPSSNRYMLDIGFKSESGATVLFISPQAVRVVQTYSRFT